MSKDKNGNEPEKVEMEVVRVQQGIAYWIQWSCFVIGAIEIIKPGGLNVHTILATALQWVGV